MTIDPEGLDFAIRTLSRLLLAEESLEATLDRVAGLACRTIADCTCASVTMINDGKASTPVQTDALAGELDRAQYRSEKGPCLEAYSIRRVVRATIAASGERWPQFCAEAEKAGIRSVLAIPLVVNTRPVGALNLFSRTADAFDS
ncbi:MAG TPA: GAF domain-containing protein, partial [Acidimicrobiia bacterium]|nr:GAF domain-containing protein [Acidimicrobiia bacterium]